MQALAGEPRSVDALGGSSQGRVRAGRAAHARPHADEDELAVGAGPHPLARRHAAHPRLDARGGSPLRHHLLPPIMRVA